MATYTDRPKGYNLYLAFEQVRDGYQNGLPGHTEQMRRLAERPIGG